MRIFIHNALAHGTHGRASVPEKLMPRETKSLERIEFKDHNA